MKLTIKYIIIIISALFLTHGSYARENPPALPTLPLTASSEKFNAGVELYSEGNFREALQVWLDLYNSGHRSASLNYNIGNAYFKLNEIPNAILFFERAYLLDPSDENINYNLSIARSLTVDRFQEIPELFFIKWYNYLALILHGNIWGAISLVSFILCLVFLSVYIYSRTYRIKVTGFWLAVILFVISGLTISFSWQNRTLVYDSHKAIIIDPQVSGKSSPDNSGTNLFVLHEGTKVSVGDRVGEWYEIRLSDGNKGWVPVGSLNII
jgi:tetratricopeptide (TPR) repeat protein